MPIQLKSKGRKSSSQQEQDPAHEAVARFEKEYKVLLDMRQEFRDEFPEADQALQEILRQEDMVRQAIKDAHALVQAAKESIGPFKCVRKWSQPGYDSEMFTRMVVDFEDGGDTVIDLIKAGAAAVTLTKDATEYFARNPELATAFQEAWKEKQEKTAAVTDPKI